MSNGSVSLSNKLDDLKELNFERLCDDTGVKALLDKLPVFCCTSV